MTMATLVLLAITLTALVVDIWVTKRWINQGERFVAELKAFVLSQRSATVQNDAKKED